MIGPFATAAPTGPQPVWDGLREGLRLVVTGNDVLLHTTLRTLQLALTATAIAALVGLPVGAALGLASSRAAGVLRGIVVALVRLPPVVVGLVVLLALTESSPDGGGPLAGLGWYTSPASAYLAQTALAIPLMTALTASAVRELDPGLVAQARAFGAPRWRRAALVLGEVRRRLLAATLVTLGVAITAIGALTVAAAPAATTVRGTAEPPTLALGAFQAITQAGDAAPDRTAASDVDLSRPTVPLAVAYATVLLGLFALLAAGLTALGSPRVRWGPRS